MTRICAPLWVEWAALLPARTPVVRTGMGLARSRRAAVRLRGRPLIVAGVGGGLADGVRAGDLVVASEVRAAGATTLNCPYAPLLVRGLRDLGLTVHFGPIMSAPRLVTDKAGFACEHPGALAVDMESAWLRRTGDAAPLLVVRAVADSLPTRDDVSGRGFVRDGVVALRALRRSVPALDACARVIADVCPTDTDPGENVVTENRTEVG
jgi:4-hydroxy-3-methylbut-2-enyl diphosphate reductase